MLADEVVGLAGQQLLLELTWVRNDVTVNIPQVRFPMKLIRGLCTCVARAIIVTRILTWIDMSEAKKVNGKDERRRLYLVCLFTRWHKSSKEFHFLLRFPVGKRRQILHVVDKLKIEPIVLEIP